MKAGHLTPVLILFRCNPAFLFPECNAECTDLLHAIPAQRGCIVPLFDLLHCCFAGGIQLLFILNFLNLNGKANLPVLSFDDDVPVSPAVFIIRGYVPVCAGTELLVVQMFTLPMQEQQQMMVRQIGQGMEKEAHTRLFLCICVVCNRISSPVQCLTV